MLDSNIVTTKDGDFMRGSDIASRFNEIYDSTNKSVLAFIASRCANTSDINDIFQDTYMELYQILNKHGADYIADGKAYVFRIAKRKLARYYSLLKRLQMFIPVLIKTTDNEEIELSDTEIDSILMEDCVVNQIMLENAYKYIEQKPADTRKIFYLFYNAGLSISEIAEELSLSESSVKNKLYRTIKELRNLLKEGGSQYENNENS